MARASKYDESRGEILRLIHAAQRSQTESPSVRDLATELGLGVATIHSYLEKLANEGLIEWQQGRHRSLKCTSSGARSLDRELRVVGAS